MGFESGELWGATYLLSMHFILCEGLLRLTTLCLGKCSMKTYKTTIQVAMTVEVEKNICVDFLEIEGSSAI